jgi:lipopolysaccharide/colanic/teichoic acid biosynthesis glycosyltransferase
MIGYAKHYGHFELFVPHARKASTEQNFRVLDLSICLVFHVLFWPLLAVALVVGTIESSPCVGRANRRFNCYRLSLPDTLLGRIFKRMGADVWPRFFNILRGDMAWVGPRARPASAPVGPVLAVAPGLLCPWFTKRGITLTPREESERLALYLENRSVAGDLIHVASAFERVIKDL